MRDLVPPRAYALWAVSSLYDGPDSDDWLQDEVHVAEPFASLFNLGWTRRFDLLANLAQALHTPKTAGWSTGLFLHHLYGRVTAAHELGLLRPHDACCAELIHAALWELDEDSFLNVVDDLGWGKVGVAHATMETYRDKFRMAFARKFAPRLTHVVRTARRKGRHAA